VLIPAPVTTMSLLLKREKGNEPHFTSTTAQKHDKEVQIQRVLPLIDKPIQ